MATEALNTNSFTKEERPRTGTGRGEFGIGKFGTAKFGTVTGYQMTKEALVADTSAKVALEASSATKEGLTADTSSKEALASVIS